MQILFRWSSLLVLIHMRLGLTGINSMGHYPLQKIFSVSNDRSIFRPKLNPESLFSFCNVIWYLLQYHRWRPKIRAKGNYLIQLRQPRRRSRQGISTTKQEEHNVNFQKHEREVEVSTTVQIEKWQVRVKNPRYLHLNTFMNSRLIQRRRLSVGSPAQRRFGESSRSSSSSIFYFAVWMIPKLFFLSTLKKECK